MLGAVMAEGVMGQDWYTTPAPAVTKEMVLAISLPIVIALLIIAVIVISLSCLGTEAIIAKQYVAECVRCAGLSGLFGDNRYDA